MLKIYVVAETYQKFRDYCYAQGIPLDGSARYISRASQLHGVRIDHSQFRFVGQWEKLPDAQQIATAVNLSLKAGAN